MKDIIHMIDKDGNVVIEAIWDGNSYCAVLIPSHVIGGISYIKRSCINTNGLDDSDIKKEEIILAITTQRGKHNEAPIVVEND